MNKIILVVLAVFIIPFSFAQATETTESLSDKDMLMKELRAFRENQNVGGGPNTKETPLENGASDVDTEHPTFGLEDLYPDTPAPKLDPQTKQALKKTQKWLHQSNTPIVQKGKIIHPFGSGIPTLVLEPLTISNIELSPDETVVPKGIQLGDTVNWSVTETYAGSKGGKFPNLIVKSKSLDEMRTVLIVSTTKRIYHIQLISTQSEWTPHLKFSYPEVGVTRSPETLNRLLEENNKKNVSGGAAPETRDTYLYAAGDIDFGYSVKGDTKIMPARVFGLGHQTVIEMDASIAKINAPALLLEDSEGNEEIVNYRFDNKRHRYILDQPIYKAYLISGVGWDQSKVTIQKLEDK